MSCLSFLLHSDADVICEFCNAVGPATDEGLGQHPQMSHLRSQQQLGQVEHALHQLLQAVKSAPALGSSLDSLQDWPLITIALRDIQFQFLKA